jgi:hypothetical protein
MKTGTLFWGILLLTGGILFLLDRLDLLLIDMDAVGRLWPLILVLWGISILVPKVKARQAIVACIAVAIAIVGVAFARSYWDPDAHKDEAKVFWKDFVERMEGDVERASLKLDVGAGSFSIDDTTDHLFAAETRTSFGEYRVQRVTRLEEESITMEMVGGKKLRIGAVAVLNRVRMYLNAQPEWELDFDVGAAEIDFDLRPFKVRSVLLNSGASAIRVRMGSLARETKMLIDAGASSITILIPQGVGCSLSVDAALSSKRFPGFTKNEDGLYETDNYRTADRRIEITIDAGVSSLKVERY